jgi:hypothetical protein
MHIHICVYAATPELVRAMHTMLMPPRALIPTLTLSRWATSSPPSPSAGGLPHPHPHPQQVGYLIPTLTLSRWATPMAGSSRPPPSPPQVPRSSIYTKEWTAGSRRTSTLRCSPLRPRGSEATWRGHTRWDCARSSTTRCVTYAHDMHMHMHMHMHICICYVHMYRILCVHEG